MRITIQSYKMLLNSPQVPPEVGGLLGGMNDVISKVVFDRSQMIYDRAEYIPNISFLNEILASWASEGVLFLGLFHTHPVNEKKLSSADKDYISDILKIIPENNICWFPIIIHQEYIIPFLAFRDQENCTIKVDDLIIINEDY